MKKNMITRFLLLILILLPLTGCAQNQAPEMEADEILTRSAERMQSLQGFDLLFDRSGAPAFLDTDETLSLSKLEGHFDAPDSIRASVRIIAPGIITDVEVISIGSTQWQTNVISGQWEQIPENWGFNPSTLFDSQIGLQAILLSDITRLEQLEMQELEEMPGNKLYTLQGRLAGENIYHLSNGLIGLEEMDIQVWIDPQTFDLHRVLLTEHSGEEDLERLWQIDFWNFDTSEGIHTPNMEETNPKGLT